jgi:predicted alpha-1,2-mannosidase
MRCTPIASVVIAVLAVTRAAHAEDRHPSRDVDPFIGTDDSNSPHPVPGGAGGSTFPGAAAPFGMLQWSPDTPTASPSGYRHRDRRIEGFSVTHFNGAGCPNNEDLPVLPVIGAPTASPGHAWSAYVPGFSHDRERASPGYYAVTLDSGIAVELAAARRSGMARLRYPATARATLLFDVSHHATGQRPGAVEIGGPDRLSGYVTGGNFCGSSGTFRLYYAVAFDRPFAATGTWDDRGMTPGSRAGHGTPAGAWVTFDTRTERQVRMKIGLSYVSVANAQQNLEAELPHWRFDDVRAATAASWDTLLRRVQVAGATAEQRRALYTALYRVFLDPTVASDVNGQSLGYDDIVRQTDHPVYQNYSGWDIYRSWIQLVAVLAPEVTGDILRSMVEAGQQLGHLPKWTHQNREAGVMNGDPGTLIVASGHAFGVGDFDARAALAVMNRSASEVARGARHGVAAYLRHGYLPDDPSTTLEETSADFALAQLARALGDAPLYNSFATRAQYWRNTFNPGTGYVQPRAPEGSWRLPLDPGSERHFVEGNAAQYTWMIPYDLRGLFDQLGGDAAAVARLDDLFRELNAGTNRPHFYMGNEPQFATPWAYNFAGAPWKTQQVVRRIVAESFNAGPGGLPGNDDLGATSSWLVWAMLGLYPAVPGTDILAVHGPLVPQVTLALAHGRTVRLVGARPDRPYVHRMTIDGKPSTRSWLRWAELARGATVAFEMGASPDSSWGSARADAPPSFDAPGVNLALHKPATGSRPCAPATSAAGAVDGSVAGEQNGWCSDEAHPWLQVDLGVEMPVAGFLIKHAGIRGGSTSDKWCSHGDRKWLQVDLGGPQPIDKVVVKHAGAGGESPAWNTRDFAVQASLDARDWRKIVEVVGNTASVTEHPLRAVPARYLRLDVVTPTSNTNKAARIYEMEAYDPRGRNLAQGRPATADSFCNPGETPAMAFDGGDEPIRNTRDFDLLVSSDGQRWTKVVEVVGNTASQTSHPLPAPTAARFVRLEVITPASDASKTARIYELEVSPPLPAP